MLHWLDCRYASNTINNYLAGLTHFAHWITQCNIDVKSIDEQLIQHFLDGHLPCCNCEKPAYYDAKDLHAALGHLLVLLRANAVIADPAIGLTPVDEELRRFDDHMGSSRFRGTTTTCSIRHNQINADLRHRARYVGIIGLSYIFHSSDA